ncbi:MAG: ATP-binding protein [Candidatus Binatia bacterium]
MFSIRGKLIIYALEIIAAVTLLLTIPPWEWWARAGLLLLSAFAIVLAVLMGRSIATGVEELARATRRIGVGDYDVPVPIRGTDEIGQLGAEIERMRVQLREKVRLLEDFSRGLERKVEERTRQLRNAHDRLALIHEVTNTVNSSLDFQTIFEAVVSGTRRLVDCDQASVARILDSDTAIVFAISDGHPELAEGRKIPLRGSRIEEALRNRTPAVFDRTATGGREDTLLLSSIVREVVLPLTVGDQVIGSFNLGSRRPDAFSPPELEVLVQIAGEIGVALLRAEAFERERLAAQKLKELSDLKSEFVSRVSHELRTPLTSILGAVDNLLDGIAGRIEPKPAEYLVRIRNNSNRLLQLINDLLDLSRIEAGEEELQMSTFTLEGLLAEIAETLRPLANERGLSFEASAEPKVALVADRDKVARVLLNLGHNAIKFTEPGGRIEIRAERDSNGLVAVSVRDTGVGIPAEEMERIFDKFHQVRRPAGKRAAPGSGLGLAICRELVMMHGGELSASSVPGHGTTFRMTLPAAPPRPI